MQKKILIIDDSPVIHILLKKVLENNGHVVCGIAKNGKDGVDLFNKLHPDIIFMDVTMPIMDGLHASRNIKSSNPSARIIMLTAMGDEEVMEEAKSIGIDIFLKKPFNDYKIISALSQIE